MDSSGTSNSDIGGTTCVYCGHRVDSPWAPATNDPDAWASHASKHDPACEWVRTRAHRVWPPLPIPVS